MLTDIQMASKIRVVVNGGDIGMCGEEGGGGAGTPNCCVCRMTVFLRASERSAHLSMPHLHRWEYNIVYFTEFRAM